MSQRKANKFPDINVPGDPRTLSSIERRTPNIYGGYITHVFGGTILEPKTSIRKVKLIDFEIYGLTLDGSDWNCKVWPGHVLNIDPKYGVDNPIKYWLATEFDTLPNEPTIFTVSPDIQIYAKVNTTSKDIITAVTIVAVEESLAITEHAEPLPSASDNGESPPPPRDGVYYYKIADFVLEDEVLKVGKQYHIGGPIIHRPNLPEFHNIPATSGQGYAVMQKWNSVESRYDLRQLVQLGESGGIEVLRPLGEGEPPYNEIPVRRVRERQSGDDETAASKQISVIASPSNDAVLVKGNGKVGGLSVNGLSSGLVWDDGLVTANGTIDIEIPAAPSGYSGTIEIYDECGNVLHTMVFVNGILTSYDPIPL